MEEGSGRLSRDLKLFDVTMIGVGAMIGAGIFVLTGEAAGIAGPSLMLSFALNGIVTIFTAMVYAELGSAIPEAGGGYLWVKEGLPGSNAFLAGWMSWFAHAVAGALYALGFGAFTFELLRLSNVPLEAVGLDLELSKKAFGVTVALAFAYINFRGAGETGLAGNIVTVAKLLVIGLFCFFGLKLMFFPELGFEAGTAPGGMGVSLLQPFMPDETGWLGVLSAMGLTFIAFEGYEIIVQAGEEVQNPRRNIPKAVFYSLVIVVPIYLLVAFVLIGASNSQLLVEALRSIGEELPEGLSADAPNWAILRHLGELGLARSAAQFVPYGAFLILIGGVLSTMSALNATTFSSTRVAFAMGRDRNLPDAFGSISKTTRTPHIALMGTAGLICFMVAVVPLTTVAAAADIMFLLLFLQVNIAIITLRKKYGDKLAYGYIIPFFPAVPIIGIVTKLGLALFMFDHYPIAWAYVAGWLVVGFGIFHFYAREREREKTLTPVLHEGRPLQVKPRSVLVAVADPGAAAQLVRLGARIALAQDSELVLLHVVTVPRQLPLSAASVFAEQGHSALTEAQQHAEPYSMSVRRVIRVAHRPATAILHTAEETDTDYIIMGWRGLTGLGRTAVGRNIDRVIKQSNSHVIVVQQDEKPSPSRILVPLSNPATAPLAVGVAASLLEEQAGACICILHLSRRPLSDEEKNKFRTQILEQAAASDRPEPTALFDELAPLELEFGLIGRGVVPTVVSYSADYDKLVIGASQESVWRREVFGNISVRIARRARCSVVLVRPKSAKIQFEVQQFFEFFRDLEEKGSPESE